jgi:hypothetical protein
MLVLPARAMLATGFVDDAARLRCVEEWAGAGRECCHDLQARRLTRHMWGRELEKSARTSRHATITKEPAGTISTTKHPVT